MAPSVSVFGGHQFLSAETGVVPQLVSRPLPLVGNTVKLVADVYNLTAGTLVIRLEGSMLGESWQDIPVTLTSTAWGAQAAASVTVTHALVRVVATIAGENAKAWFEVGVAFTDQ